MIVCLDNKQERDRDAPGDVVWTRSKKEREEAPGDVFVWETSKKREIAQVIRWC